MAVILGVVAVALAAAGVVAVVNHDDGNAPVTAVLGSRVTTTTSTPERETTTTATAAPPGTTTTSPPTTVARTTTTRRTTTTTARPATTTTAAAPGPTGTTTPPSAAVLCAPNQIDIGVVPNSTAIPAGQPVTLHTTIRNRSSDPCFYRGYTVTMTFLDPAGNVIISQAAHADDAQFRPFAPGQALSQSSTWTPSSPPAPGIYSVAADWSFSGGRYGATQQYVLTAP
jgi:hypothetical protein